MVIILIEEAEIGMGEGLQLTGYAGGGCNIAAGIASPLPNPRDPTSKVIEAPPRPLPRPAIFNDFSASVFFIDTLSS